MAEVQPQVLDGVRQAAAVHPVASGMAADGGQLLRGHAGEQRLGVCQEADEARAKFGPGGQRGELGVAVALDGAIADAADVPTTRQTR